MNGVAYVISRTYPVQDCLPLRQEAWLWLAGSCQQAWPAGAALSAFFFFLVVVVTPVQPLPLRALGTGPPFNKLHSGTSWVQQGRRGREGGTPVLGEKEVREKKMQSSSVECGRENTERARREGGYSGRGKWKGQTEREEMRRKKRTELMGRRGS